MGTTSQAKSRPIMPDTVQAYKVTDAAEDICANAAKGGTFYLLA
jgi:hypothetical protein